MTAHGIAEVLGLSEFPLQEAVLALFSRLLLNLPLDRNLTPGRFQRWVVLLFPKLLYLPLPLLPKGGGKVCNYNVLKLSDTRLF